MTLPTAPPELGHRGRYYPVAVGWVTGMGGLSRTCQSGWRGNCPVPARLGDIGTVQCLSAYLGCDGEDCPGNLPISRDTTFSVGGVRLVKESTRKYNQPTVVRKVR